MTWSEVCSWGEGEETDLKYRYWKIKRYDSAGIWLDSANVPCLVIHALFEGEDDWTDHLLYEDFLRDTEDNCDNECLWVVQSLGKGDHLRKVGDLIDCDGPAKAPPKHAPKAAKAS